MLLIRFTAGSQCFESLNFTRFLVPQCVMTSISLLSAADAVCLCMFKSVSGNGLLNELCAVFLKTVNENVR